MNGLRLLFVTQRYGAEVVGGSEHHARRMAERLAARHEVEVATTNALDYWTWAPHYREGVEELNGVLVRRFAVRRGRSDDFKALEHRVLFERHTLADERAFVDAQGPVVPDLFEFLHDRGARYHAVVFYTYIYAPTALGLPLVPERAALVPTAHDELPLRLAPYRAVFQLPRAIGFLTPEERDLVRRTFRNEHVPSEVIGFAPDPPPQHDAAAFRARRGIDGKLVVYLGQVSEGKGCDELLANWASFRERDGATLMLLGEVRMTLPDRADVVALGRVTDEEKYAALSAADALVLPSHLESLGIVLLEAWQVGTPVLVPAWNAVTAGQVRRSGGGLAYGSAQEFGPALARLLAHGRALGASGRAWVERECSADVVEARFERLVAAAAFRD